MFGSSKDSPPESGRRGFLKKLPLAAGAVAVAAYQEKKSSSIHKRSKKTDDFFKDKIKAKHLKQVVLLPRNKELEPRGIASESREPVSTQKTS
jgi:hypothetical protein